MKIFKLPLSDGRIIRGLLSESTDREIIIIHFHGFGGDCFANDFLRIMHEQFPIDHVSFLSVNTPYSGYLVEDYSENNVAYVGASICDYNGIERDIDALIGYFKDKYKVCILQGHSFGTNLVKLYLRKNQNDLFSVFLSPADSVALYEAWRKGKVICDLPQNNPAYVVRTDNFGMITDYGEYQIPMTDNALRSLLQSDIFKEWSEPIKAISNNSLIIKGSEDRISNFGTTGTWNSINMLVPNAQCYFIADAKHIFSKYENELYNKILEWINSRIR